MSASSKSTSSLKDTHIQHLERKITNMRENSVQLPGREFYDELLTIIHKPGWTTLPESMFVATALESIQAHTQLLVAAHQQLMDAAKLVGEP